MAEEEVDKVTHAFTFLGTMIHPKSRLKIVEDPDDDMIINAAYDGAVDFIVSGDSHLLKLKGYKAIKIVSF